MLYFVFCLTIISILILLFFYLSKFMKWNNLSKSVFECGFSSYFFSRNSFSIHYFMVALAFLFFDLEISFLFPYFLEESSNFKFSLMFFFFTMILTLALLLEWKLGFIDWKN